VAAAGSKDTTSGAGGLLSTTGTVTGTLKGTLGSAGLGGTLRGTLGAGGADAARQLAEDQALEKAEKVRGGTGPHQPYSRTKHNLMHPGRHAVRNACLGGYAGAGPASSCVVAVWSSAHVSA
jgi:hypothetical protein